LQNKHRKSKKAPSRYSQVPLFALFGGPVFNLRLLFLLPHLQRSVERAQVQGAQMLDAYVVEAGEHQLLRGLTGIIPDHLKAHFTLHVQDLQVKKIPHHTAPEVFVVEDIRPYVQQLHGRPLKEGRHKIVFIDHGFPPPLSVQSVENCSLV
jgi:hypothetical protein